MGDPQAWVLGEWLSTHRKKNIVMKWYKGPQTLMDSLERHGQR